MISEPQHVDHRFPFLAYIRTLLKTCRERFGADSNHFERPDPVDRNEHPADPPAQCRGCGFDVLRLTCDTWNWKVQRRIAIAVKTQHPDCVVVAGGPEPDYKGPEFFLEHPHIDVTVVKDGKIAINKILSNLMVGDRNFEDISGLYTPNPDDSRHEFSDPDEVPTIVDYSPCVEQRAYRDVASGKFFGTDFNWAKYLGESRGCAGNEFC